jgi:uncharacterized protein Yka (UPF0111/DUF47 family)
MKRARNNSVQNRTNYEEKIATAKARIEKLEKDYDCMGDNWLTDIRSIHNLQVNVSIWKKVVNNLRHHIPSHGEPVGSFQNSNLVIQ